MNKINLLLVDDQILFINSLKDVLLLKDKTISISAVLYNGEEALNFCRKRTPDIILMDVKMPKMDGVEATKLILQEKPEIKIIMLTTFSEDEYVKEAMKVGAKGYLLKDMLPEDLLYAVKNVHKGMISISPSIINNNLYNKALKSKPDWFRELNRKEIEILRLITYGYDNDEIAEKVYLAKQTVKNYVSQIYEIMDVKDRMHAMRICIDLKLFED